MAAVDSALKGDQHRFMGKGPRAGGLKVKEVSGLELENLGIFGVQSVSCKGKAVTPRAQCKQVAVGSRGAHPSF